MGLNYDALKDYEPGGSKGAAEWFRPKPGDGGSERSYTVRIVLPEGKDFPFFDSQIHYFRWSGGFESGACARENGEFCPACDMFFTLRLVPGYDEGAKKKLLRGLSPATRVYTNVIVRGTDRVQVWSMPYTFAQDLKNQLLVYLEDGVDLTDPKKGHDLSFAVEKKGAVQSYGSITVRPRASEIGVEDWEAQCFDLKAKAHSREFDEKRTQELLEQVLGDEAASMISEYERIKSERKAEGEQSNPKDDDDEIGVSV